MQMVLANVEITNMKEYRIVKDGYLGYEVQGRRWWFPIWMQCYDGERIINTFRTVEEAELFAKDHAHKKSKPRFVRYLGKL
jgi:hypothetical protein